MKKIVEAIYNKCLKSIRGRVIIIITMSLVEIMEFLFGCCRMVEDENLRNKEEQIRQFSCNILDPIFEIFNPELDEMKKLIRQEMESAFELNVPLAVDIGMGDNWYEAH